MDIIPFTLLSQEMAKVIFEEEVSLPLSMEPIELTKKETIVGNYQLKNEKNGSLTISIKQGELYLTVPKRYGVFYKFKLVPVEHSSTKITFITEIINEQLIFHYSASGEIESVEYTDFNKNTHRAFKEFQN